MVEFPTPSVTRRLTRTVEVSRWSLGRRDSIAVFLVVTAGYLFGFLYVSGNLDVRFGLGTTVMVVSDPLSTMFEPGPGPFTFEPIALIDLWIIRFLLSPINFALALGISILVGLNIALSYLILIQPKACGIGSGTGFFVAIPALLSGSACCAPVILLVLGIQAGGVMLTAITWLLPIGVLLLVGSLIYLAQRIETPAPY